MKKGKKQKKELTLRNGIETKSSMQVIILGMKKALTGLRYGYA